MNNVPKKSKEISIPMREEILVLITTLMLWKLRGYIILKIQIQNL